MTELADKFRQLKLAPDREKEPMMRIAPRVTSSRGRRGRRLCAAGMIAGLAAASFWSGLQVAEPRPATFKDGQQLANSAPTVAPPSGFMSSGHVVARRQATIAAQATGLIRSIAVEEGQRVEKGALIARLDDRSMLAGVERAQATSSAGSAEIDQLIARRSEASLAERRFASLAERGFARRADLDGARADLAAIEADIRRSRALRAGHAADARAAAILLDRASIRAPFGGIVTRLSAQPGEIISPISAGGGFTRTGICTIVDMDSLEIEVDVSESQIANVRPGQATQITLQAYPDRRYPGRVLAVVPVADRARASFRVRVAIERADERMLPEMAARVFFLTGKGDA